MYTGGGQAAPLSKQERCYLSIVNNCSYIVHCHPLSIIVWSCFIFFRTQRNMVNAAHSSRSHRKAKPSTGGEHKEEDNLEFIITCQPSVLAVQYFMKIMKSPNNTRGLWRNFGSFAKGTCEFLVSIQGRYTETYVVGRQDRSPALTKRRRKTEGMLKAAGAREHWRGLHWARRVPCAPQSIFKTP